jgi:hypothetical protein
MRGHRALCIGVLVAALLAAQPALADGSLGVDDAAPAVAAPAVAAPPRDDMVDARSTRNWDEGTSRFFLSTTLDVGALYLRPRASVGYGRPHATWVGFDANPVANNFGVGAYGGLRATSTHLDLRIGARTFRSWQRSYLAPAPSYERVDLETDNTSSAVYHTFETELTGNVVLGPGELEGSTSASYVTSVPAGQYVFEETLRVIVKPPWVLRGRVGYHFFVFPQVGRMSIGPVLDVLNVPERETVTVRLGLFGRVSLSRSLELRIGVVPALYSVDHIGLASGDFWQFGLRHRWATGK